MIENCDAIEYLDKMPATRCVFMDIPDNIGLAYIDVVDRIPNYIQWVAHLLEKALMKADIVWMSYNQIWDLRIKHKIVTHALDQARNMKQIIWRYTFGQYNDAEEASGYRPILRFVKPGIHLNYDAIRVESERMKKGDKRAAGPRIPDDVWEYPRIVKPAKERREWHPTQHPEALLERILLLSCTDMFDPLENTFCQPIGGVVDPFMGSGTTAIVAKKLGIPASGCDLSPFYVRMINYELGKINGHA